MEQIYFQNFFHISKLINEGDKDKDKDIIAAQERKNALSQQNIKITTDLEGLYDKLFYQAEDVNDHYKKKEEVRLNFTSPESVAQMEIKTRPEVMIES